MRKLGKVDNSSANKENFETGYEEKMVVHMGIEKLFIAAGCFLIRLSFQGP